MATTEQTLRRTNENPGTRAKLGNLRTSPYKVREVLNLIRGEQVGRAQEILRFCERGPAEPIAKVLTSAVANAVNNDELDPDELFVTACFADEGPTMKRFRPRAKGRAGRIRKRTSSITIVVARLPEDKLERLRTERAAQEGSRRRRVAGSRAGRVAGSRKQAAAAEEAPASETEPEATATETPETPEVEETTTETTAAEETPAAEAPEDTEKEGK